MRRGNGEGSVFKLGGKRRKPWTVRVTIGWKEDGKQIFKYVGYYRTKTEAKEAAINYLIKPFNLDHKNTKLSEVFDEWIKTSKLASETLRGYRSAFSQAEILHNMNMRDIKANHIEGIMEEMKPHMRSVFKNAMTHTYKHAIKCEIVDKNIMELISVRTNVEIKEKAPLTVQEIQRLKTYKHSLNDTAIILLYTGMRISELLDIETKNVHLDKRYMVGGTKTKAGKNRIIPIHDEIFDLIKARYDKGHKYLITAADKKVYYNYYRLNYWNKMAKELEFKHTPHSLRHTFVTFADQCGIKEIALKRIIGHVLTDTTEHYNHRDVSALLTEINKLKY